MGLCCLYKGSPAWNRTTGYIFSETDPILTVSCTGKDPQTVKNTNLLAKITSLLYSISPNCLTRWGKVYGQTCTKSDPYESLNLNLLMLDTKLINSLGGRNYCIELLFDASIFTRTRKAKDEKSLLSSTLQWSWHIWKFVFYEDMQNGTLYNLWTMLKG